MVERSAVANVLARHSLDFLLAELGRWLRTNLAAQEFQRTLPAEAMPNFEDWHVTVPSLALLDSDRLRAAEAIIRSGIATLEGLVDGSLSHPPATLDVQKTEARSGTMTADELGETVDSMERRMDRIEGLLERFIALLERDGEAAPRSA